MMKKSLVTLVSALVLGLALAGLFSAFGGASSPTVFASRLAGIQGSGISGLQIQNLDNSQSATIVADFYSQRGGVPVTLQRNDVLAGAAANIYLPSESSLANGAYSALITADRQIAAIARTDWSTSGAAAIYSNVQSGTDISLPLAAKRYLGQSSIVSVQNTNRTAQATVTVQLFAGGSTTPVKTTSLAIASGSSVTMDLAKSPEFTTVPDGFLGSMRFTSGGANIGVQSFIDIENVSKAVYAFEGVPSEQAADKLYVPLIRNDFFGTTGISVVNPGTTPVQVTLTYIPSPITASVCTDRIVHGGGPATIPAGSSIVFYQGGATPGAGAPGLPAGCLGSATVESTGGNILAIVNDANLKAGTSAAYNAVGAAQGSRKVALPLFRNEHTNYKLSTGIQAMNIGTQPANATITFADSTGTVISGCGADCQTTIAPNASYTWYPPNVQGIMRRTNTYGSATIESDQPLAVIVNDASPLGNIDSAIYNGIRSD
jgi:hypothetical protein